MSTNEQQLTTRVDEDAPTPTVFLEGELDLAGTQVLEPLAERVAAAGWTHVVLDLGGLTFVDSSGLRTLLDLARELARTGATITTHAPSGGEARLLIELTRTQQMLGLEDEPTR